MHQAHQCPSPHRVLPQLPKAWHLAFWQFSCMIDLSGRKTCEATSKRNQRRVEADLPSPSGLHMRQTIVTAYIGSYIKPILHSSSIKMWKSGGYVRGNLQLQLPISNCAVLHLSGGRLLVNSSSQLIKSRVKKIKKQGGQRILSHSLTLHFMRHQHFYTFLQHVWDEPPLDAWPNGGRGLPLRNLWFERLKCGTRHHLRLGHEGTKGSGEVQTGVVRLCPRRTACTALGKCGAYIYITIYYMIL